MKCAAGEITTSLRRWSLLALAAASATLWQSRRIAYIPAAIIRARLAAWCWCLLPVAPVRGPFCAFLGPKKLNGGVGQAVGSETSHNANKHLPFCTKSSSGS
jgi:hypothetical protein